MNRKFYDLIPGENGQESRLYIDGEITAGVDQYDWWTGARSKGAQQFRRELEECGDVTVYINSPGGDVFAGSAMYGVLKDHPHRVTVKIMGIAASAASVVAMAGDEVLISPVGFMMIHDPWCYASGNARELEQEAQVLREIGDALVTAYQKKTSLPREEIERMLSEETYMNAQSAIELGFCDGLWEEDRDAVAHASAPAAVMRGRDYAPAAYVARLRAQTQTIHLSAGEINSGSVSIGNLPRSLISNEIPAARASALALVQAAQAILTADT